MKLDLGSEALEYTPLADAAPAAQVAKLPYVVRVFLENVLRRQGNGASDEHVRLLLDWATNDTDEFPFFPARVILQDFTGVPCVVDLAALRSAVARLGGNVTKVNPKIPVDLVIDHSVIVDAFGSSGAFARNVELEYERNRERYQLLRWAQTAFDGFRVVPPGAGIVHQVNLEYLGRVVFREGDTVYPDTLLGTDSHTTMIGGLGVLGWGVGGIEAEAAMLGEPISMLAPLVVGVRLDGRLPEGATATDLVLAITELLRKHGVVAKFVEFYGPGLHTLTVADRATISNMSPEYGATEGIFPVDAQTIAYLQSTGRDESHVALVEAYAKTQGLFHEPDAPDPEYTELLTFDLGSVEPSLAGPRRPQDRVALGGMKDTFRTELPKFKGATGGDVQLRRKGDEPEIAHTSVKTNGSSAELGDGSVVIAAITSCTNTSNPSVMVGAGLLAKNAVEKGLKVSPTVKTSLAPGSPVVMDYLSNAGLVEPLEQLGFYLVGFGCTTCIAGGTSVLQADGTAIPIETLPYDGGAKVYGPAPDGGIARAEQTRKISQGLRDCVVLTLQDGRELVCTPDHEILRSDGHWIRADELEPGVDRVVTGLEAPNDIPAADEDDFELCVGHYTFTMRTRLERRKTLAFARLLGHLLDDGSISTHGQGRMNVGQAVDREAVLSDIELICGKRPKGARYDERKWSIVLPMDLTAGIMTLPGVRVGRRIEQPPALPSFVLDEACPTAVVREFLGGVFGADGTAPVLKRMGPNEDQASLQAPQYSHGVKPQHVADQRLVMEQIVDLLARCSVRTNGSTIREYPVRRAASSYPAARDGEERIEVRLELPDGLSFVTNVGFRYSVDKSLRASAAAVYWRTIETIERQRLWMADRLTELHQRRPELSFRAARDMVAAALEAQETIVFPHYATLQGTDRFSRMPEHGTRQFRPHHRDSCGFPSPAQVLRDIGARDWFAALQPRASADFSKRYCVGKESLALPALSLQVIDRRPAGEHEVYDLSVEGLHAFVAGTVAVHNCIGNSGPLPDVIAQAIDDEKLTCAAVLSGNRNFEGRIHPHVKMQFLASPPLVVAYALAGTVDLDLTTQPIGTSPDGQDVYLRDIWPTSEQIAATVASSMDPEAYRKRYAEIFTGDERWHSLDVPEGELYHWDADSTYIAEPPFVADTTAETPPVTDIVGARVLALVGDSVTTDHISPAGVIPAASPAGDWLQERGVDRAHLHSYGARRGNHEVMVRGTFANIRLRNQIAEGKEGGYTKHFPSGEIITIFEASERYRNEGTPLVVLAGTEYGTGSSRDWAAKGTLLLGVRAALAASFERIHRANLVQMGALPLQLPDTPQNLGLHGDEVVDIEGLAELRPGGTVSVTFTRDGETRSIEARVRVDTQAELRYFREGGILPSVVREMTRP